MKLTLRLNTAAATPTNLSTILAGYTERLPVGIDERGFRS